MQVYDQCSRCIHMEVCKHTGNIEKMLKRSYDVLEEEFENEISILQISIKCSNFIDEQYIATN